MSNTREDSNSGQTSDARQKAHKGNFRHQANVNVDRFGDYVDNDVMMMIMMMKMMMMM